MPSELTEMTDMTGWDDMTDWNDVTDVNEMTEMGEITNLDDFAFDQSEKKVDNTEFSSVTALDNLESVSRKINKKPILEIPAYNVEDEYDSFYEPSDVPNPASNSSDETDFPMEESENSSQNQMPINFDNETTSLSIPDQQPPIENIFSASIMKDHDYCKRPDQGQSICAFRKTIKFSSAFMQKVGKVAQNSYFSRLGLNVFPPNQVQ